MVNWIEMVVLDPNNKRGHVFEAWIRLIQNECEIYIYIAYVNIYDICKVLVFFLSWLGWLFRQQIVLDLG